MICGAFDAREWRDPGDPGWQAWDPARRAWTWEGSSEALMPSQPIAIDGYPGRLLISAGEKDTTWSSKMSKRLSERYAAGGKTAEQLLFPEAGHMLSAKATMLRDEEISVFFMQHLA